jgi:adenosine kinase
MILVSGSLAFDTVMRFEGRFADHLLADRLATLSVAFEVGMLRRDFGGCAGNICYSLALLGERAAPWGTVGGDFDSYRAWFGQQGIPEDGLHRVEGLTAQAYIMTDSDNNQITAFHPGAMTRSAEAPFPNGLEGRVRLGIVAPDSRDGMRAHAQAFQKRRIPYLLDPGQALGILETGDFEALLKGAGVLALNAYEAALVRERFGYDTARLANQVQALVVTHGREGSHITVGDRILNIPAVPPEAELDPTGCGDAYRAGLVWGWTRGCDWAVSGRIASLLGSFKIAHPGTQNHRFTPPAFWARYAEVFGEPPPGSLPQPRPSSPSPPR